MARICMVFGIVLSFAGTVSAHGQQFPDAPSALITAAPLATSAVPLTIGHIFDPKEYFNLKPPYPLYPDRFRIDFPRTLPDTRKHTLLIPRFGQWLVDPQGQQFISAGKHRILITPSALTRSNARRPETVASHHGHEHMHH